MFVHLPRTGGTTVSRMLEAIFGARRALTAAHFYDTSREDLTRFALVEGHKQANFFVRTFGQPFFGNGFTILREPVARVVSQARHIRALEDHRDHAVLTSDVDDPAALFERVPLLNNLQTKLLSGVSVRDELDDVNRLTIAKAALDRMAFGLTESFDHSVCLLAERFALELPRFGVTNASPATGDDDLRTEDFRAEARTRNDFDAQLHRHATSVLATRVEHYVSSLLDLSLDEGSLECSLRSHRRELGEGVSLRRGDTSLPVRGWALIDGRPADAVLVRTADTVTPLCCRVFAPRAARPTRSVANRHSGIVGTVPLPANTETVDVIAFDRARQRRAEKRFEIRSDATT